MEIDIKAAQFLCSRICHDLIGPIGAINAGMELRREMGGESDDEALDLVARSAQQATRKVEFFRMAFGMGSGAGGTVRLDEARDLAGGFLAVGGIELDWPDQTGLPAAESFPLTGAKLLLNLVLLGVDCLPRGGTLRFRFTQVDGAMPAVGVAVTAHGAGARVVDAVVAVMGVEARPEGLSARNVHGHFASRLAQVLGTEIEITAAADDEVGLAVRIPTTQSAGP